MLPINNNPQAIDQNINASNKSATVTRSQLRIATFNLFNYLEPPNAFYEFERIYSAEQWRKKQRWIVDYLEEYQPDVIGFQEVFSIESLKLLMDKQGYHYFAFVDQPEVIDEFIYKRPVVAIASRYPIVEVAAVGTNSELVEALGLAKNFSFSRKVLRATIELPHIGKTDCYVVHLKSKRSIIEPAEHTAISSPEQSIIKQLAASIAGGWGASIQRGSEAALLMVEMLARREATQQPIILMGDFNSRLSDGVLSHVLTNSLPFANAIDSQQYLAKYCLRDAWELYQQVKSNCLIESQTSDEPSINETDVRKATHYFGSTGSVLDYILLSSEFDAGMQTSFYEVSYYEVYDRHLINPSFERDDQSTDHAIVSVTLILRESLADKSDT